MKRQKASQVKANASIKTNSIKFTPVKNSDSSFSLSFVFESNVENFITVYFMA